MTLRRATLAGILTLLAGCHGEAPDTTASPSVQITVVRAQRGSLPVTLSAYGTATPAQNGVTTLSVAQPGQVTSLAVTQGSAVKAGQVIVTFTVAPSARGSYLQAVDALAAARKQRTATAALVAQQLATADQLVQADKAVSDASIALKALGAEGAGQSVQVLRAPYDGIVTTLGVSQGDRTQPGAPLVTLARTSGIVVTVGIDPADRAAVRPGATVTLQRLSSATGQQQAPGIAGKVLRVDDLLNPRTRLIDVDISAPSGSVLAGEGMQVAIHTGDATGWIVPHQSVVTTGGGARVFQDVSGKAIGVPVTVVLSSPRGDVVRGALDPARPVIVEGAYQVNDGDAVRRDH
ncbi:efflux RND transporter periplasmic adaptor subunit [Novosphingobium sp. 9]|uniref:efflux RND transporter periplasmic adaptor subunit n=1 Tax=Novosphingobium sp. 9 TaxID=2025349 RepID=UPI0021B51500|nr:efflux RND transporter periplasmic adaptor subunit [Novosphingobium sp. 9]